MEPSAAAPPAEAAAVPVADPAPQPAVPATVFNHPPYEEMILAAITALKSPGGSSKKDISDYIDQNYQGLPQNHSAALALHLRDLRAAGRLVMARSNYRLAEQGSSSRPKRGRPAKAKANAPDTAPPVVAVPSDDESPKANEATPAAAATRKRGRPVGRPPAKRQNKGKAVAVPAAADGTGRPKRSRGRPPKVNKVPFAKEAAGTGLQDQPEGSAGGVKKLPVRRRGRLPRSTTTAAGPSGQAKSKAALSTADAGATSYRVEYELLQKKVEVVQNRINKAVAVLKPRLAGEGSPAVMDAIVELEAIAAMDM